MASSRTGQTAEVLRNYNPCMMSNQKAQSSKASGMKFEVVSLNRGSSQAEDSPEQVHLDRIFNFKFIECNVRANQSGAYREDRNEKHLVASDLCERLCTLARMVISYSHLFTLWKNKVHGKRVCDLNIVDKCHDMPNGQVKGLKLNQL